MSNITKRTTKLALLVAALSVTLSATAQAQPFRHGGFGVRVWPHASIGIGIGRPYFDPFWGPDVSVRVLSGGVSVRGPEPDGQGARRRSTEAE